MNSSWSKLSVVIGIVISLCVLIWPHAGRLSAALQKLHGNAPRVPPRGREIARCCSA